MENQAAQTAAMTGLTVAQLKAMPKVDTHAHVSGLNPEQEKIFMDKIREHNMHWNTISTVGTEWKNLQVQISDGARLHAAFPDWIDWTTSFNLENWGKADWLDQSIATITDGFAKGAVGVKVWKEIGMVLKDPDGRYVMIDDPRFDLIFDFIASRGKTVIAHIGEPRNCWLPLDSMTVNNDRGYFKDHPQYHAYLHPEIPDYWKQIESRDRMLEKHPDLRVVGAHLGSLEFDVSELAKRFDRFPNFAADMGARVCHFQVQDREKVRNFIIKYQDQLLYGIDVPAWPANFEKNIEQLEHTYSNDYIYFATDQEMEVPEVNGKFRGLALPAGVLRKMYSENFLKWFPGCTYGG